VNFVTTTNAMVVTRITFSEETEIIPINSNKYLLVFVMGMQCNE